MIARILRALAIKRAKPFDAQAYEADLEARLADRRAKRGLGTAPAKAGHSTRLANAGAQARAMFGDVV